MNQLLHIYIELSDQTDCSQAKINTWKQVNPLPELSANLLEQGAVNNIV